MTGAEDRVLTPLGDEDARILALESGPIRGHTLKVLVVDEAPDEPPVQELRESMSRRLRDLPRWRQRVVAAPGTPSGAAWEDDPDFDVARHVTVRATGRPLDEQALRRQIAQIMRTPLERDRPLWSLEVLPRLDGRRWALVWKVHHCLADGATIMRVGRRLLWDEGPAQGPSPHRLGQPGPAAARVTAGDRLGRLVGHRGLFLREFRRVRRLSPLAGDVGPDRTVAFTRCTLDELRSAAKAVGDGVTVNDVLLSVVAGGLRSWMAGRGSSIAPMKVQVPVSMHADAGSEKDAGNRDSYLLVNLPLGEADPLARLRAVNEATRVRKSRNDAQAVYALRESLSRAPKRVRRSLQRVAQGPHEYSLNVSNVPGPRGPIHVLGRHVSAMYSFAEVAPHHGLRVAALSLEGVLSVGLCADPQLVPDLDALAVGIRRSVDELLVHTGR